MKTWFPKSSRHAVAFALLSLAGAVSAFAQLDSYPLDSFPYVGWQTAPSSKVTATGAVLSTNGFVTDANWFAETVPGTAFAGAVKAGKEDAVFDAAHPKDAGFGANVYKVTRSKYDEPYWHRASFVVPSTWTGKTISLNFDGLNQAGDIYLNGRSLGSLFGFMQRGKYDVTAFVTPGQTASLAVRTTSVQPGDLFDAWSPTYMGAPRGWDWMPPIPGSAGGITDHVYLTTTAGATLVDPWMRTVFCSTAQAKLAFSTDVKNTTGAAINATVTCTLSQGGNQVGAAFSKSVSVPANGSATVAMDASTFSPLVVNNPKLWWPNGYGAPDLYSCVVQVSNGSTVCDQRSFNFGIRQYTYVKDASNDGNPLVILVNGQKVFARGGSWGMSDYLLNNHDPNGKYDYDTRVKLHQDMHMNMIRNWAGCTTDHEFYDACDRYGIMVWDDFWLVFSYFPVPSNLQGFKNNAVEKVKRLRNHPCVAVWCGANESVPYESDPNNPNDPNPPRLNSTLASTVATYDANDRLYQPSSNSGNLSGSGTWSWHDPHYYFSGGATYGGQTFGFRTELGTAVLPNYESVARFIPADHLWPANANNGKGLTNDPYWQYHFWGTWNNPSDPNNTAADSNGYANSINNEYGTVTGVQDLCGKAQLANIEATKAMFEAWNDGMFTTSTGILTWMSQSAYPSMLWQTYDYYYDQTGAYWGAKKACEPVHIQWNPNDYTVKVVNASGADLANVTAKGTVYNKDGTAVSGLNFTRTLNAPSSGATFASYLYTNGTNLALGKTATASSVDNANDAAANLTDGTPTRWSSAYNDNQWVYVDLGSAQSVQRVVLHWEGTVAYGKSYQIQTSNDASTWTTVYSTTTGAGGMETISFAARTARYVKMNGLTRGSQWGFSLYEFEVYGASPALSDVHFIRLALNDASGNLLSDNFYWRGTTDLVYTGLSSLGPPALSVGSQTSVQNGQATVTTRVTNSPLASNVAFAVRMRLLRDKDGSRILPALMSDNYFTLFKGESKTITTTFDAALLGGASPVVVAQPYNSPFTITSAASSLFTVGAANTFAMTSLGLPTGSLSLSGALPGGVTFVDNGNGTATLGGSPAVGSNLSYPLTLTAHNGTNPDVTQSFSLLINRPPVAGSASYGTVQNTPVQMSVADLLRGSSDPDGDALSVLAVTTPGTRGGTASLSAPGNAGTITYQPAPGFLGGDSLAYTLSDGRGGVVSGTISVTVSPPGVYTVGAASVTRTAAAATVAFTGLPGATYQPQYTDSLTSGVWTDDGPPLTADGNGQLSYVDRTAPPPAQRFYRLRYTSP